MTPANRQFKGGYWNGLTPVVLAIMLTTGIIPAIAQTPQYSFSVGTAPNNIPFNPAPTVTWQKYQGFYNAGLFAGAPAGYITKVYWQRGLTSTATTYANCEFSLAQSTQTTFSTTQFFTPMTVCFSAASHTIPAGSASQWFSIQLQTPFYYDPSQTLITQFCSDGILSGGGINVLDGGVAAVTNIGRIWGGPGCSATPYNSAIIHQNFGFDITPGQVNDAGVSALISPVSFCSGTHPLQINVKNYAGNTINTVTINWTYDGVPQTPVVYNTPIPSMGDALVTLGSQSFATGVPHTLRAWTSMPNNVADTDTQNDTLLVTIIPANTGASITPGGPPAFCEGGSVVLNANTGAGLTYQWLKDLVDITGATSSNYVATQAGSYRVIVSNTARCSDTSAATVVTILPAPAASITAGGPTSFCEGGSVTLSANTGAGLTYKWLRDFTEINGAVSPDYTATQAGSYRVVLTNSDNCVDTSDATVVTILTSPGADITPGGPTTFCDGESVVLNANTGAGLSYIWLKDGSEIVGATSSSYTVTQSGSYRVLVTNTSPCSDTSSATLVTVFSAPDAIITAGGPTTFCAGGSVLLNANTGLGLTYQWLKDGLGISAAVLPGYTATQQGSYRVIVTNAGNCSDTSDATTVVILDAPSVYAGADTTICQGGSTVIGREATGGTDPYLYSWDPIDGLSDAYTSQPSATPSGTTRYVVTVRDANGCEGKDTVVVTVRPSLEAQITPAGPIIICSGDSVALSAPQGMSSYNWLPNGETTQTIIVKSSGLYTVDVTDGVGCKGQSRPVEVSVHPRPSSVIAGPVAVCPNSESDYEVPAESGLLYNWMATNGTILSGASTSSVRVRWGSTGFGIVQMMVTNPATGCSSSAADTVQIRSALEPRILPDRPEICAGGSVELDAGPGYATYLWSTGETTRYITARNAGRYIVTVDDGSGCSGSDTVDVTERPALQANVDVLGATLFCEGERTTLRSREQYARYRWFRDGAPTGDTLRSIFAASSGRYIVEVQDSNGCQGASSGTVITVHPRPQASIIGAASACVQSVLGYSALPGAGFAHEWLATGGTIESGQGTDIVSVRWSSLGSAQLQLIVREITTGCADTTDLMVAVSGGYTPRITVIGDTMLCEGDTVILEADAGYETYEWSTGERTRSITVTSAGTYQVRVADAICEGQSQPVRVVVLPQPSPVIVPSGPITICAGDSVTLSLGQAYEGYLWSTGETTPSITVRESGAYSVTVTNTSGCEGQSELSVITIDSVEAPRISGPLDVCINETGRYVVPVEAGIRYQWTIAGPGSIQSGQGTNMVTVLWLGQGTGTVELLVTDNASGCTNRGSVTINVNTVLTPSIAVEGRTGLCPGETTILRAPPGYQSYRWSTNETSDSIVVSQAGTYTVTVTSGAGCMGTSPPLTITVFSPMKPVITQVGMQLQSSAAIQYQWYLDDTLIPGATAREYIAQRSGLYYVKITDSNGCTADSDPMRIQTEIASSLITIPNLTATPGEVVRIPIVLESSHFLTETGVRNFTATLSFNRTLLRPLSLPFTDQGDRRRVQVSGQYSEPSGTLFELECLALLGDRDITDIAFEGFNWDNPDVQVALAPGELKMNLCLEGGTRLYYATGTTALKQNWPNPFNSMTMIEYEVIEQATMQLFVVDMNGRRVATLVDGPVPPGRYLAGFDAGGLASGQYLYILQTLSERIVKVMEVIK